MARILSPLSGSESKGASQGKSPLTRSTAGAPVDFPPHKNRFTTDSLCCWPRCCGRCWQHAGPHISARVNLVGSGMSKKNPTTAIAFSCLIYSWLNSSLAGLIPTKKLPMQKHGGLEERAVGRDACLNRVPGGLVMGLPLPAGSTGVGISVPGGELGGQSTGLFHRCLTSVNQEAVTQVMGWV